MKFTLPGPETVTLAGHTIDKLVRARDGDAALLYLYILKTGGRDTSAEAAAALGRSPGGIATAMAVLSRLGLVKLDDAQQGEGFAQGEDPLVPVGGEPPPYPQRHTVEDMKRELEAGLVFHSLVDETQRRLGKILSPDELLRLFGIYDSLRMAPEVILQLVTHCINESRGRASGRMPSMRYIEKAAYTWEREGIFSLDKAEEYIKALDERKSVRGEIKRAMQIRDREFSETEKRYVDNWIEMGFEAGAIGIAYDRTILKTGKMAWSYMDTIIKNWHGSGLHTPEEIRKKDRKPDVGGAKGSANAPGQKFGPANQEEVARMERILKKIKETS